MKKLLPLILVFLSHLTHAADWKVIAETTSCEEKIQILAKEGEPFVYVLRGNENVKLFNRDRSEFHQDSPKSLVFSGEIEGATYTFSHPSMVESTLPKFEISKSDARSRCPMRWGR